MMLYIEEGGAFIFLKKHTSRGYFSSGFQKVEPSMPKKYFFHIFTNNSRSLIAISIRIS